MRNQFAIENAAKLPDIADVISLVAASTGNDGSLASLFFKQTEWDRMGYAMRAELVKGFVDFCNEEQAAYASGALVDVSAEAWAV